MRPTQLSGAKTHNLQSVDLELKPGSLVAVVGPSGAGKSSLAFGTLYAEGQRRFIESFSAYARQFLERLARPQVDELDPVPAAIAVDRQGQVRTSRSTVGSMTDVSDYAKSLWARLAQLHCPTSGEPIRQYSAESAAQDVLARADGQRAVLTFPRDVRDAEGFIGVREGLVEDGYRRVQLGGETRDLDEVRPTDLLGRRKKPLSIPPAGSLPLCEETPVLPALWVVADRVRVSKRDKGRLVEAFEAAFERGGGRAQVHLEDGEVLRYATQRTCLKCEQRFADPSPGMFSFNSPVGACDTCRGFGRVMAIDFDKVLPDPSKTLARGAIAAWGGKSTAWERKQLKKHAALAGVPLDVPVEELSAEQRDWLLEGDEVGWPRGWFGLRGWFKWLESRAYKMHVRVLLSRYRKYDPCPDCDGTRFKPAARAWRVSGVNIADFHAMSVDRALSFLDEVAADVATQPEDEARDLLIRECQQRLRVLSEVGLGYLTLDRAGNTLSGGETQRVALTSALGASLTGALFVLDEPTVGLHPRDVTRLFSVVRRLSQGDNIVLLVEHDPHMITGADRVVELGPGAGDQGGQIVFDGTPEQLLKSGTATGLALGGPALPRAEPRKGRGRLRLKGARGNNLRKVDIDLPVGGLTCVTGVSGSGKSTLVLRTLVPAVQRALGDRTARPLASGAVSGTSTLKHVVHVDQSPLVRTSRGNPATYVGAWDVLRKRFAQTEVARQQDWGPGFFSTNVAGGRCEVCKGQGFETVEMQFLADVTFSCPACAGQRFVGPVMQARLDGLNVSQVLELSVDAALERFASDKQLVKRLGVLAEVGLGYLRLGQPLNTLSGGEAQRLKLAQAFTETSPGTLVVLDEPTAGLHPRDVSPLLRVLDRLVDELDATVVVVEHDMTVAAHCDHVLDLGPGAGAEGGTLVASGTPAEVAASDSPTAPFLAAALSHKGPRRARKARATARTPGVDALQVRRAREHNLREVDLDIPRNKLVVVTGPSGSGKSSLAFGVVHAEGQRRFIETLSPYARQYLPQLPRPAVDQVLGVPPTLSLEQRVTRGGANSTVATITEVAHYLRLLFARVGTPDDDGQLSGGGLHGAADVVAALRKKFGRRARMTVLAPVVQGRKGIYRDLLSRAMDDGYEQARIDGNLTSLREGHALERFKEHDIDLLVAKVKSGDEELLGAVRTAAERADGQVRVLVRKQDLLLSVGDDGRSEGATQVLDPRLFSFNTRQGACPTCEGKGVLVFTVGRGKKARDEERVCPECEGSRLSKLARSVRVQGHNIVHYLGRSVDSARAELAELQLEGRQALIGETLLKELDARLRFLQEVGLGYLGLDRSAATLSGGETQRVRLAAQLGSGLTGVLYVLDEPTIGLHPRDTGKLLSALRALVDRGNSVLVVEHDTDTIMAADHVVDMGPGGGHHGGRVLAQASPGALLKDPESVTGQALAAPAVAVEQRRTPTHWLNLKGARHNNLKGLDVDVPLGCLAAVTGVSGSGKSTLVREVLLPAVREELGLVSEGAGGFGSLKGVGALKRAVEVDQSPIGRTPRSVPATYVGIWDTLRKLLAGSPDARARGYDASRFSFNVAKGRCPVCDGNGALTVEMAFLPDALVPCEACDGMRFAPETLEVKLHGLNAGQILELEIAEAAELFSSVRKVAQPLTLLTELGLGYLKLGQPSNTLSGGEAQRLKLVAELSTQASGPTLYVLDEPTTGLHRTDVQRLLGLLQRFVERGDSVLVIEHHADVMLAADWLIDLGPEGGEGGGTVVGAGTPDELARLKRSHTGKVLRQELAR